jgi:hypothetical protein
VTIAELLSGGGPFLRRRLGGVFTGLCRLAAQHP